jgi:hypothetical protein
MSSLSVVVLLTAAALSQRIERNAARRYIEGPAVDCVDAERQISTTFSCPRLRIPQPL